MGDGEQPLKLELVDATTLAEAFENVRREYVNAFAAAKTQAEREYLVAYFSAWLKACT